ncbi:MAG: alpha/beta fold hydrolase [Pseudomonadota bacterium]
MRKRRLALAYTVLLAASWVFRLFLAGEAIPPPDVTIATLGDGTVIAHREYGSATSNDVLVLLHGSPMAGTSMVPLARSIEQVRPDARVLVPDMPGFGESRQSLNDFSIVAHAEFTLAWMDQLGIERAHIVGYSMGGGVALEMYQMQPQRTQSLTMLASIGVQELELLGEYHANHAVHGVQLALISLVDWFVPHFGALDHSLLNRAYARNFYDTDQRPLRKILESFQPPMLIVHGNNDPLVPYAAAVEHARIVPQARLDTVVGGHELPFRDTDPLGESIATFIDDVSTGQAPTRDAANAERLAAAAALFDRERLPDVGGMTSLIVGIGVILFSYVSEDLATIAAGLAASAGVLTLFEAIVYAFIGIYTGDMLVYWSGRLSRRARKLGIIDKQRSVERAERWFQRRGITALLIARFVPGTRFPTFFAAGALGMSMMRFSVLLVVPALVWTPALVYLADRSGERVLEWLSDYQRMALPALLAIGGGLWLATKLIGFAVNPDQRRLAIGRWKRLRHWEFWPSQIIYAPVILALLAYAIRYRSLTVFTAANPAIPLGGFVGESKAAILAALPQDVVPPWRLLEPASIERRVAAIEDFMASAGVDYPVVLKPDSGERGSHVRIIYDNASAAEYFERRPQPTIVQDYVPGEEYGVFYYRLPGVATGRLFAVTIKEPISLIGDGRSTLEQLILTDPRAVAMADVHCRAHRDRLPEVLPAGQKFRLVQLGTHARGCVFRDGRELISEELTAAIDRISHSYDGFYFGRYDIRVPSRDALLRGEQLSVIELNGVTSEATNIYDPQHSVLTAWSILVRQWGLAFDIGARNRDAGVPVANPGDLLAAWREARRNA